MKKITFLIATVLLLTGCTEPTEIFRSSYQDDKKVDTTPTTQIPNANKLDLSNQGLAKISQNIFTMSNLEELDVSGNKLTGSLPAEIRHLQKLKILDASNNLMTGVPAEVGQLQNLEILNLSNNQLTGLPNELGNLKSLKVLNLSGNQYSIQDLEVIKRGLPADVDIIL